MPRLIDSVPTPTHVEPKKLIVLSAPRTGTHGTYEALKRLGFKPYHMAEVIKHGPTHLNFLIDGFKAEMLHEGKPYGREEFDKWFADYDIIIEMPFFMLRSVLKAYPDANFLLTERDPNKWAKSFINTVGARSKLSLSMSILKHFDDFRYAMANMAATITSYYTNGYGMSPEGYKALVENYKTYIADVKRLVPPEQLKVCRLEDGFGWNELCPCVGVPVPDAEWPALNTPEEFHRVTLPVRKMDIAKNVLRMTSIIAPFVAAGFYYLRRGRISP